MKNFSWREWHVWAQRLFQDHRARPRRDFFQTARIENLEQRALLSANSLVAVDEGTSATDDPPPTDSSDTAESVDDVTDPKTTDPDATDSGDDTE